MEPLELSEGQKARVRTRVAAEKYRDSLMPKKRWRELTLWEMMNSAFGLWFCSAVVVAGLTAVATKYAEFARESDSKRECLAQLHSELHARVDSLFMVAGRNPTDSFTAAELQLGRKIRYVNISIGPRAPQAAYQNQSFSTWPAIELLRTIESSAREPHTKQAARDLKQDALLIEFYGLYDENPNYSFLAGLLGKYYREFSNLVYSGTLELDPKLLSPSCTPTVVNNEPPSKANLKS